LSYDPRNIANYFLQQAESVRYCNPPHTYYLHSLELQKLATIAHGYYHLLFKKELVAEALLINEYEPYFASLAKVLQRFGDGPIDKFITDGSPKDVFMGRGKPLTLPNFTTNEVDTLNYIWSGFFDNSLRCVDLAHFTRGYFQEWQKETEQLTLQGVHEYPVERLAERIRKLVNPPGIAA